MFELATRSYAQMTNTASVMTAGFIGAAGVTSRVPLVLDGSGSTSLANGGVLTPTLEAGLEVGGGRATVYGYTVHDDIRMRIRSVSPSTFAFATSQAFILFPLRTSFR